MTNARGEARSLVRGSITTTDQPKAPQQGVVMNLRLLIRAVIPLLLAPCAGGQQMCGGSGESVGTARVVPNIIVPVATVNCDMMRARTNDSWGVGQQSVTEIPSRAELLRRIAVYEAAARGAKPTGASDATVAKAYARLGSLYQDAAMYDQSEAALEHAISLLRGDAQSISQLAMDINYLGSLHREMGKLRQAEKEELEALRLRQSLGDSLEIARSWNALAALYFKKRKYTLSRDFAQRAVDEFSVNKKADVVDGISSRFNLSVAMCYAKDCPSAIPLLKDAIAMAKTAFKTNDFPLGEGKFFLGFAYWKSGDSADAAVYMKEGTDTMKEELGWGHPAYLSALAHYARFLRENSRVEEAEAVERQIRRAETVVDVHSVQARNGMESLGEFH